MKKEITGKTMDSYEELAGKYLSFLLLNEEYAVEILKVQEIIRMQKVTPVPKTPDYIRGVINLRGKVIPVVELRVKFNMSKVEDTEKTVIVVLEVEWGDNNIVTMGIIIDEVKEVMDISAESIEKTPALGNNVNTDFIIGICKSANSVKMLLDIAKVLSTKELKDISQMN